MKKRFIDYILYGLIVLVFFVGCGGQVEEPVLSDQEKALQNLTYAPGFGAISSLTPAQTHLKDNVALGFPELKTINDPYGEENYLIRRDCYVLSYNNIDHNPNWISWHVCKDDLGKVKRTDMYLADPQLPTDWKKVVDSDYDATTFSRGHMCPNADRTANGTQNIDTFKMTNIVPQAAANNTGAWGELENALRTEVKNGNEVYVVCGPYGKASSFIGGNTGVEITIPTHTWKVAIVIPEGSGDLNRINSGKISIKTYAVMMPNDSSCTESYDFYSKSIDYIEEVTGFDFFALIDDKIENEIEAR